MEGRLDGANSEEIALLGALEYRVHQPPARAAILRCGIDRDWSNAGDCRPFVQAITADYLTVALSHHELEIRIREHLGE
jgi:hypothetical protein